MKYVVDDTIIYIKKADYTMLYHRKLHKYFKLNSTLDNVLLKFIDACDIENFDEREQEMAKSLAEQNIIVPCDHNKRSMCKLRKSVGEYPLDIVQIEITKRCNFRCDHCYIRNSKQINYNDMMKDDVFKIIDDASQMGVFEFNITGGEPLLHPDIEEILKYIYEAGMRTRIYTNGYLITDRLIELFKKLDVYRVRISVDGKDSVTHDKIRGVQSLDIILNNIEKLTEAGINVEITTTLMKDNINDVNDLLKKFENRERVFHIIDTYISEEKNDPLKITEQEYVDAIKRRFINWNYCDRCNKSVKLHCGIADYYLFIASDGVGKLCPTLPKSYDLKNVLKVGLKAVWDEIINKYYGTVICNKKSECEYGKVCDGGCRSRALYTNGNIISEDTYMCKMYEYLVNREQKEDRT
jgi:radical SAM protein with 4Fe4S-binding SPASM domain